MAIFNRWITDVFLCLLLSLFASASNRIADNQTCYNDSAIRTSQYMTYHGCYNLSCFVMGTNSSVNDIDQCTERCKNGSHPYAALLNGNCSCGNFNCVGADMVCDFRCGFPCIASQDKLFYTCGGKYYFQLYKDETSSNEPDSDPNILPVAVVFGVIAVAACLVCLTCYVYGRYGRGRKRRQDRHRAESPTMPTELTSRRQRPQRRDNVYSITGLIEPPSVNITNGHSFSSLHLSSENAYDHTTASGRIQNTSILDRGCNSLPRCLSSNSALPLRNRSGMQKVTEGDAWQGDDECSGFCCSDSKYGVECSCRGGREPGRPQSDRRSPRAKPDSRGRFLSSSEKNARGGAVEDNRARQMGESTSDMSELSVREMGRGPRRDVFHGRSLKGRGEMEASPNTKRGMLALPRDKETIENQHSRKKERLASQVNNGRPPVSPRIAKAEGGAKNNSGAFYHTLETEIENSSKEISNDTKPSTSTDYFTLEQSDYSVEPSDIRFATVQNDAHRDFDETPTCSVPSDPQYDYAAIPGLSNLRNLPCRCKPNPIRPNQEEEEGFGMIDNVLYNSS